MPRTLFEIFEANVRSAAAWQGFSLDEVARRSGISVALLLAVLSGERDADPDLFEQIADGVGVGLGSLERDRDRLN
jgi:transcriptional regulator with XRE-family HTH domain